jgi:hypothetical protein
MPYSEIGFDHEEDYQERKPTKLIQKIFQRIIRLLFTSLLQIKPTIIVRLRVFMFYTLLWVI